MSFSPAAINVVVAAVLLEFELDASPKQQLSSEMGNERRAGSCVSMGVEVGGALALPYIYLKAGPD